MGLYFWLHHTRAGLTLRAVSVNPSAAGLVSINVARTSALAFALGGAVSASGGALLSMFLKFDASLGVIFTLKALVIVIMGGVGDIRGAIVASFILGLTRDRRRHLCRSGPDAGRRLYPVHRHPAGAAGGPVREAFVVSGGDERALRPFQTFVQGVRTALVLSRREQINLLVGILILIAAALLPVFNTTYWLSIGISIAMFTVLATSWALFSGPTNYISLATAAFFGIGMYIVGGGLTYLPFPALVLVAALIGALFAAVVGLATLRISGVYFVIFTLGLAELVRQVVAWAQHVMGTSSGLYVLIGISDSAMYWLLLGLAALVYLVGWFIGRSRLGFALRIIGNDEVVAVHCGINTARAKVVLFVISSTFASITGALVAPRWSYVEPSIAFSPFLSFEVVIMALLGGVHRLWGPLVGVIPFTLLWEFISAKFPAQTTLLLGACFLLIVYFIPRGVVGLIEDIVGRHGAIRDLLQRWKGDNA